MWVPKTAAECINLSKWKSCSIFSSTSLLIYHSRPWLTGGLRSQLQLFNCHWIRNSLYAVFHADLLKHRLQRYITDKRGLLQPIKIWFECRYVCCLCPFSNTLTGTSKYTFLLNEFFRKSLAKSICLNPYFCRSLIESSSFVRHGIYHRRDISSSWAIS